MPNYVRSAKDPEKNLINLQKRQLMSNIIYPLFECQQYEYSFPELEPLSSLLRQFPIVIKDSEKDLRNVSLLFEPKDCDPKSVL